MVRLYQKVVFFCFSLVLLGCSGGELSSADLFEASFKGDTKHVAYLIKKGVDVNAVEEDGWTASMIAQGRENSEIVHLLRSKRR